MLVGNKPPALLGKPDAIAVDLAKSVLPIAIIDMELDVHSGLADLSCFAATFTQRPVKTHSSTSMTCEPKAAQVIHPESYL